VHVIDTAGLRGDDQASDEVERIGIARSWEAIAQADAVLFLHDLSRVDDADYRAAEADIAAQWPPGAQVAHVFNKLDLVTPAQAAAARARWPAEAHAVSLCARSGEGLADLRRLLLDLAGWHAAPEGVFIARARHVHALQRARAHLEMAIAQAAQGDAVLDLVAEELRLSHDALAEITGQFSADDLLGEIFSRFCIGK